MQQREVTFALGQTGSGKSYWADQFQKLRPRVLVADAGFQDFSVNYVPSFDSLVSFLDDRRAFGTHRPFRVGYDFLPEEHDLIFQTCRDLGNVLLVLEEADRFSLKDLPGYQYVVYRGRHHNIELLDVSLSPKDIPTDVRRQATRIVSFKQIMPDDLDWLAEIVGDEAYRVSSLKGPPSAPPNPYLLWTPVGGARIVPAGKFEIGP